MPGRAGVWFRRFANMTDFLQSQRVGEQASGSETPSQGSGAVAPRATPQYTPPTPQDGLTEAQRAAVPTVSRVVDLARAGHLSRAVRIGSSTGLLPLDTPEQQAALARLHPESDHVLPQLPAEAPFVPVLADDNFKKLWKQSMATGASAGPSLSSGDHALPLLDDQDTCRGLACIVQRIRNGRLDDTFKPLLLPCFVVGAPKPDGSPRPVAIGETLYKFAAILAINSVKGVIPEVLGPAAFAFLPGGSETAGLCLKALLETHTGLMVDLRNAFNSTRRA